MTAAPAQRPGAWRRRRRLAAGAVLVLAVLGWQSYLVRHYVLRTLTLLERAVVVPAGPGVTAAPAPPAVFLHAARTRPGTAPNSRAAVAEAAAGFRRVEVDVGFSRDLVPYLSHGDDLAARAGRPLGFIEELDARQLDALPLLDGSRLVRLEDFLAHEAHGFDEIALDVKARHGGARQKAAVLARLLAPFGVGRVLVVTTSSPLLFWLKGALPQLRGGSETFGVMSNWLAGFDVFSAPYTDVAPFWNGAAQRLGLRRFYWTAHTPAQLDTLLALAPDALIVDLGGTEPPPAGTARQVGAGGAAR